MSDGSYGLVNTDTIRDFATRDVRVLVIGTGHLFIWL